MSCGFISRIKDESACGLRFTARSSTPLLQSLSKCGGVLGVPRGCWILWLGGASVLKEKGGMRGSQTRGTLGSSPYRRIRVRFFWRDPCRHKWRGIVQTGQVAPDHPCTQGFSLNSGSRGGASQRVEMAWHQRSLFSSMKRVGPILLSVGRGFRFIREGHTFHPVIEASRLVLIF